MRVKQWIRRGQFDWQNLKWAPKIVSTRFWRENMNLSILGSLRAKIHSDQNISECLCSKWQTLFDFKWRQFYGGRDNSVSNLIWASDSFSNKTNSLGPFLNDFFGFSWKLLASSTIFWFFLEPNRRTSKIFTLNNLYQAWRAEFFSAWNRGNYATEDRLSGLFPLMKWISEFFAKWKFSFFFFGKSGFFLNGEISMVRK